MANINIDLTTLSGWSTLSTGTHAITVKAKASGYLDSNASNSVNVTKAASGYSLSVYATANDADIPSYEIDGDSSKTGLCTENDTIVISGIQNYVTFTTSPSSRVIYASSLVNCTVTGDGNTTITINVTSDNASCMLDAGLE